MTEYRIARVYKSYSYNSNNQTNFWWEVQEKVNGWFGSSHWESVEGMAYVSEERAIRALKVLKGES